MLFLIGLLTVVLVVDCAILTVLVLIQLPKKEAGAGLAFGGAATDALFGAGSGNVLTKITKYAATLFFVLAITLSAMQSKYHDRTTNSNKFLNELQQSSQQTLPVQGTPATTTPDAPASAPPAAPSSTTTSSNQLSAAPAEATNVPVPASSAPSASDTNKNK
jgi:preprotein translocase subunit SecG